MVSVADEIDIIQEDEDIEQQNQAPGMTVENYFLADPEQENATSQSLADLLK